MSRSGHLIARALAPDTVARQTHGLFLAAAAEMYALLHMHQTIEAIEHIVRIENRSHGLSHLSGDAGGNVAKKWVGFVDATGVEL